MFSSNSLCIVAKVYNFVTVLKQVLAITTLQESKAIYTHIGVYCEIKCVKLLMYRTVKQHPILYRIDGSTCNWGNRNLAVKILILPVLLIS